MPIYSLEIDDFSDDDYTLIGLHTALEDYRLAFLLNKKLQVSFRRTKDLDLESKNYSASYAVFEYEKNSALGSKWFLIANVCKVKQESVGLFDESETKIFLIPEKKQVDFFLKIEGDTDINSIEESLEKINQIPQIITSYQIETNTLKSKEFLIF